MNKIIISMFILLNYMNIQAMNNNIENYKKDMEKRYPGNLPHQYNHTINRLYYELRQQGHLESINNTLVLKNDVLIEKNESLAIELATAKELIKNRLGNKSLDDNKHPLVGRNESLESTNSFLRNSNKHLLQQLYAARQTIKNQRKELRKFKKKQIAGDF